MNPTTTRPEAPAASLAPLDTFPRRHTGMSDADRQAMLDQIGVGSVDALIEQTVPRDIRLDGPLELQGLDDNQPLGEAAGLARLKDYADRNKPMKSMIGMGYHGTITPPVILRNVLENPRWYTPYTPYQAEIAQGRLEALLNFQTMVADLTGLPLAGSSLLDEATAAAEAMAMCFNVGRQKKKKFYVADDCHPQTIAVVRTRASGLGIEVEVGQAEGWPSLGVDHAPEDFCGILLQYPTTDGRIEDYSALAAHAHEHGALVVAATDLLACCLITPPGEWGADIAVGSSQRFGVPMGYGGPHAAFLATQEKYARKMPGRLIGVSKDVHGNLAYRMAIQTREQHIKRDKATSNICTAQVLLAITAGLYATYHGPEGLKAIAQRVHQSASALAKWISQCGHELISELYFDTIRVRINPEGLGGRFSNNPADAVIERAKQRGINLRKYDHQSVCVSLDETTTGEVLQNLLDVFCFDGGVDYEPEELIAGSNTSHFPLRTSPFLQHPVFNQYHTEHELLRYTTRLIDKDYGLAHGMIPLGSCTMKLNAAVEMIPITWESFANMHPFCPPDQAEGYRKLFDDLESWLAEITGFAAVSLQPNAGSQGEYAGLMAIRAYHEAQAISDLGLQISDVKGETPSLASEHLKSKIKNLKSKRTKCLIPTSAHGTNPASAVIAGMTVVPVKCRDNGDIDMDDLAEKAKQHADELAALMITYPSTHGVFEDTIRQACELIHQHGGQVYMDGANMNAQVGLTSPGHIGADVCHLNLHKTFCIPHGGGGPGMGPIGVAEHLREHLPGHPFGISDLGFEISDVKNNTPSHASEHRKSEIENLKYTVSAAPYGSPMILPISWMYIALMGSAGLKQATEQAILNANYMAARLRGTYDILYTGAGGTVAHEFIVDVRPFEKSAGVTVDDFAKRLMDYGFHAPTMSWPVAGTLMIEPTESESKAELDRFCDAMISIRAEIARIENGDWPPEDNPLKGAPHTAEYVAGDDWPHPYPRKIAAYPAAGQASSGGGGGTKFWPAVGRIDNPYGDRNLICTCPPMESFES